MTRIGTRIENTQREWNSVLKTSIIHTGYEKTAANDPREDTLEIRKTNP